MVISGYGVSKVVSHGVAPVAYGGYGSYGAPGAYGGYGKVVSPVATLGKHAILKQTSYYHTLINLAYLLLSPNAKIRLKNNHNSLL